MYPSRIAFGLPVNIFFPIFDSPVKNIAFNFQRFFFTITVIPCHTTPCFFLEKSMIYLVWNCAFLSRTKRRGICMEQSFFLGSEIKGLKMRIKNLMANNARNCSPWKVLISKKTILCDLVIILPFPNFYKKCDLKILLNSQENTCGVLFSLIKLYLEPATLFKKRLQH